MLLPHSSIDCSLDSSFASFSPELESIFKSSVLYRINEQWNLIKFFYKTYKQICFQIEIINSQSFKISIISLK